RPATIGSLIVTPSPQVKSPATGARTGIDGSGKTQPARLMPPLNPWLVAALFTIAIPLALYILFKAIGLPTMVYLSGPFSAILFILLNGKSWPTFLEEGAHWLVLLLLLPGFTACAGYLPVGALILLPAAFVIYLVGLFIAKRY